MEVVAHGAGDVVELSLASVRTAVDM